MQNQINLELVGQFINAARETAANIERISANAESLNNSLTKLVGNELVLLAEPDDLKPELFSIYKFKQNVITLPTKEQLSTISIGITDCFCGIASTGSVCVSITKSLSCLISALTQTHIVVLDSRTIVPKPRDIFLEDYLDGKDLKRSFSIITGTSATADMGPLVRGVHGPGKLHIIVLD